MSIYTILISLAEGLIRDVVGYPSFALPQDTLPADSYLVVKEDQAFTVYFKCYKGGQVTKPIILVKICYKLLCQSRS